MTKRRTGPPLYELIHTRPERSERHDAPPPRVEAPASSGRRKGASSRVAPGRMLSTPAGYAFVACAIAVGLIAGAFMVGYRSAENAVRAEFEAAWLSRVESDRPDDPLMAVSPGAIADDSLDRSSVAPTQTSRSNRPMSSEDPGGWGPIQSDPRQPGRMYFVLMETRQDGAIRLARFLREEGLEAYVVPIKDKSIVRVITLPALATSSQQNPMVADLKRKIEQAGLRWQLSGEHDNLSGAYIRTY